MCRYLFTEEEPKAPASPVSLHVLTAVSARSNGVNGIVNGVVRPTSPVAVPPCQPAPVPAPVPVSVPVSVPVMAPMPVAVAPPAPAVVIDPAPASLHDFANDHSRPSATSNSHGYVRLVVQMSKTAVTLDQNKS